jgi:hypothetical protein
VWHGGRSRRRALAFGRVGGGRHHRRPGRDPRRRARSSSLAGGAESSSARASRWPRGWTWSPIGPWSAPGSEGRRAQLVERGERQLHLLFDPDGAGHPEVRAGLDGVVEQRRLADARLAVTASAVALVCRIHHAVEDLALALPSEQPHPGGPRDHPRRTLPGSRTTDSGDSTADPQGGRCLPDGSPERSQVDNRNHRHRPHRGLAGPAPRRRRRVRRPGREPSVRTAGCRVSTARNDRFHVRAVYSVKAPSPIADGSVRCT